MRWRAIPYNDGDVKIVRKFSWLPRKVGVEYRWLEWTLVLYRYLGNSHGAHSNGWVPGRFMDSWGDLTQEENARLVD